MGRKPLPHPRNYHSARASILVVDRGSLVEMVTHMTAEYHLREIITAYNDKISNIGELLKAIQRGAIYLQSLTACEFQTDYGLKCNEQMIETIHGMKCCKLHASIRKNYYGDT
jgi:hypothetical protein